jgi:hypothetical protein
VSERRALQAVAVAALLVWAWIAVPLAAGQRTLFMRDVFGVHLPLKAFGAAELREGRIPAFFDRWSLGAPYRGNPQALAFYPGNLLYLALPFWSAFNLHYALHWLLAFFAMRSLARALGQAEGAQLLAALAYAGGGVVLSALSFYNLIVVLAWWPWVMAGVVRGGRRNLAWGALACGMAILGGEPVSLAVACLPLAWAAVEARGARRGLAAVALVLAGGALVALPQIVATARILPFSFRAAHGMEASQASSYALHPLRALELVVPLPWGWPARAGAAGWWARRVVPRPPFFYSLYFGVAAAGLAMLAARARRGWAVILAAAMLAAWLGGEAGDSLARFSLGLFRYPEKFLVAFAIAAALLAGWGMEKGLGARRAVGWWIAGGACAAIGAAAGLVRLARLAPAAPDLLRVQSARWALYFLAAGALLAGTGWCLRRGWVAGVAALQLAGLIQLWPLVPRIETAPLAAQPAWLARTGAAAVHSPNWSNPRWLPLGPGPRTPGELAAALDPAPGVLHGLSYPLAPDFEGMASPLATLLHRNLAGLDWPVRVRWMQTLGVDYAVLFRDVDSPALALEDRQPGVGYEARLYRVRDAAPPVFWPARVRLAASPVTALDEVPDLESPTGEAVVSRPVAQSPDGAVELASASPDRLAFAVKGGGGVAVVRRAYHPLWRARVDGAPAPIQPADLVLLGVEVPPGEHRVELDVANWPEAAAGFAAIAAAALLLATGMRAPR